MASNALASIAAATAAGWKLQRPSAQGKFVTTLSIQAQGVPGVSGEQQEFAGESTVSSAAADTVALANVNNWRANRYGSDSGGVNSSPQQTAAAIGAQGPGTVPTHGTLTKDKH